VICEIMNRDGSMARGSDLAKLCSEYGFTMVTVAQLVRYRLETEIDQHDVEGFIAGKEEGIKAHVPQDVV
jgi:3,4-dihydroxy-2-butanone 4-phosphate synthase